jgi:hypothetical protein
MDGRHAVPSAARSRIGMLLISLATACGLWFGITAPDVSPVAPAAVPGAVAPAVPVPLGGGTP